MSIRIPVVTTNPVPVFYDIRHDVMLVTLDGHTLEVRHIHVFEHDGRRCVSADEAKRVGVRRV